MAFFASRQGIRDCCSPHFVNSFQYADLKWEILKIFFVLSVIVLVHCFLSHSTFVSFTHLLYSATWSYLI